MAGHTTRKDRTSIPKRSTLIIYTLTKKGPSGRPAHPAKPVSAASTKPPKPETYRNSDMCRRDGSQPRQAPPLLAMRETAAKRGPKSVPFARALIPRTRSAREMRRTGIKRTSTASSVQGAGSASAKSRTEARRLLPD
jgi:hypothetical protein